MALASLNKDVLLSLWPPNRILAGLCCCKRLRAILVKAERVELCLQGEGKSEAEQAALTKLLPQLEPGSVLVSVSICSSQAALQYLEDALLSGWAGPAALQITPEASARCVQAAAELAPLKRTLPRWTQLKSLNLSGLNLGIPGAQQLACAIRALAAPARLETLELGMNGITDVGLAALVEALEEKECTALRHLGLGLNEITEEGVACLARKLLPNLRQLESLGLGQNRIWDAGMAPLVAAWKEGPELQSLDLGGNRIGEEGAGLLAGVGACGRRSAALRSLDLSYNRLDLGQQGAAGAASLPALLRACPNLRRLDLAHNGGARGSGALEEIARALGGCEWLEQLSLGGNDMDDEGATAVAGAVAGCSRLALLSVRSNRISDTGLAALARALAPARPHPHPHGSPRLPPPPAGRAVEAGAGAGGATLDFGFNVASGVGAAGAGLWAALEGAPARLQAVDLSYNLLPPDPNPALARRLHLRT